jgi:polar amino acid transport system substrate-binding protein
MTNLKGRFAAATATVLLALGMAACGSSGSSDTTGSSASGVNVPASIANSGVLSVAMEVAYPPFEYFKPNTQTPQGFDVDITNALAKELGVKADIKNVTFDAIIPGLQAGRYDLAISAINDTADRQNVVTFVDYFKEPYYFIVKKGTNPNLSPDTLCGLSYGVATGSSSIAWVQARSDECEKAGKPPVNIELVKSSDAELLMVKSGRADFATASGPVAKFAVKKDPSLEISGKPHYETPDGSPLYGGIAIPKDDTELVSAVKAALERMIQDGTYDQIAEKWDVADCCAITKPIINSGH